MGLFAGASAESLVVGAASSLGPPLKQLIAAFEREQGTGVKLVLASSGKLFAQIQNGAPFDIYIPADVRYLQSLPPGRLKAPARVFAKGQLALFLPQRLNLAVQDLTILRRPEIRRIAVANPKHAPYGRAAIEALKRSRLFAALQTKLVYGQNVAQAAQMAVFAADAGLIDLGSAMRLQGQVWVVPASLYEPLEYGVGLLSEKPAAHRFFDFITGPKAGPIFRAHGLVEP